MRIWWTTAWTLLVLLIMAGCHGYSTHKQFNSTPYDTNDSGYVQGVVWIWFFLALSGMITAFLITPIALKLKASSRLQPARLISLTMFFAVLAATGIVTYPATYVLSGGNVDDYGYIAMLVSFTAGVSSALCAVSWWCFGLLDKRLGLGSGSSTDK